MPMASMPHTGFQRLDGGGTTVIMDTGKPPPANVSQDAHAGCLSFELSAGPARIITNCGMPATGRDNWRAFARETSAHTDLVFHETSSCEFVALTRDEALPAGRADHRRPDPGRGLSRDDGRGRAAHAPRTTATPENFGLIHRRSILLSEDGSRIDGEDALESTSGGDIARRG